MEAVQLYRLLYETALKFRITSETKPKPKPKQCLPEISTTTMDHSTKRAAASAAPPNATSPAIARGMAAFEVGVEACEPEPEVASEVAAGLVVVAEVLVGVASAFFAAEET
jgi:hypothetical protein